MPKTSMRHYWGFAAALAAGLAFLAAGPRKSYENVNREIVIDAYWADSQPASNIMPGARTHDREEKRFFESRTYWRYSPQEFAKAILAADMKVFQLLRSHAAFQKDDQPIEMDMDRLRGFVIASKANPDSEGVYIFKAGYLVFSTWKEEGLSDLIAPIDPSIAEELSELVKQAQ